MTTLERIAGTIRGDRQVWPQDTDWSSVLTIAERHGVAMLLARSVSHPVLRAWANRATERGFGRVRQLRAAVAALNDSGIDVLAVKGPVLAVTAYGDHARRGVGVDLDLVVRPQDFQRALATLLLVGYIRYEGAYDPRYEREQWESEAHLLPSGQPGTMIELHTDLVGNARTPSLAVDDVIARAHPRPLFGVQVRVMAVEDQLLYLCLHGARHGWSCLLWVCDIDAVLRQEPLIDWAVVATRAAEIDATRRVALGLYLAHTLLGTPLPPSALSGATSAIRRAASVAIRCMAATDAGQKPTLLLYLASELSVRETLTQRLVYLRAQFTPTPRDRAWIRLPPGLAWLYFVLRPIRLLTRYGQAYEERT